MCHPRSINHCCQCVREIFILSALRDTHPYVDASESIHPALCQHLQRRHRNELLRWDSEICSIYLLLHNRTLICSGPSSSSWQYTTMLIGRLICAMTKTVNCTEQIEYSTYNQPIWTSNYIVDSQINRICWVCAHTYTLKTTQTIHIHWWQWVIASVMPMKWIQSKNYRLCLRCDCDSILCRRKRPILCRSLEQFLAWPFLNSCPNDWYRGLSKMLKNSMGRLFYIVSLRKRCALIIKWVQSGYCALKISAPPYKMCCVRFHLLSKYFCDIIRHPFDYSQVDNVRMIDRYNTKNPTIGTLYITATHIIFVDPETNKETWVIRWE